MTQDCLKLIIPFSFLRIGNIRHALLPNRVQDLLHLHLRLLYHPFLCQNQLYNPMFLVILTSVAGLYLRVE